MLGDIGYCRLIEQYNDERKSYLVQRDDEKWKMTVMPKLQDFCELFHSMLSK